MKKIITAFIFFFTLSLITPHQQAFAASTTVTVTVYDSNGDPVYNANVLITCEGDTNEGVSQNDNNYHRTFGNNKCDPGENVTVSVEGPNGETGIGQGVMGQDELNLVINLTPNVSVPEFGMLPGLIAAIGSAGAFLKFRKII